MSLKTGTHAYVNALVAAPKNGLMNSAAVALCQARLWAKVQNHCVEEKKRFSEKGSLSQSS